MSLRFIYRCLKARFKDEKWELYSLMKHLNDDDIFIDVGANKGSYLHLKIYHHHLDAS